MFNVLRSTAARACLVGLLLGAPSALAANDAQLAITASNAGANAADALQSAVADSRRGDAALARDSHRHPLETLQFFGVTPTSRVAEIWPGGGYYMDILAPLLKANGVYYAASFNAKPGDDSYFGRIQKALLDKLASDPDRYSAVQVTAIGPPAAVTLAPAGSATHVLTFRNVHNWMQSGTEAQMFAAFATALGPDGILGVVEHRAKPGTSHEQMVKSGYVTEAYVIAKANAAGFDLVDASEVNANAADTKDHPAGVWTLPPTLRLKDENRAAYQAIGESDRMTLKFKKRAGVMTVSGQL